MVVSSSPEPQIRNTYPAIFIPLNLLLLLISAAEAALVNELGKLLLHHILDLGNGLFQALLASACNVQVQRRVLLSCQLTGRELEARGHVPWEWPCSCQDSSFREW